MEYLEPQWNLFYGAGSLGTADPSGCTNPAEKPMYKHRSQGIRSTVFNFNFNLYYNSIIINSSIFFFKTTKYCWRLCYNNRVAVPSPSALP